MVLGLFLSQVSCLGGTPLPHLQNHVMTAGACRPPIYYRPGLPLSISTSWSCVRELRMTMLGVPASSPAGSLFRRKPEKDSCSGLRMVRLNIRCSTVGPLLALDACTSNHPQFHTVCFAGMCVGLCSNRQALSVATDASIVPGSSPGLEQCPLCDDSRVSIMCSAAFKSCLQGVLPRSSGSLSCRWTCQFHQQSTSRRLMQPLFWGPCHSQASHRAPHSSLRPSNAGLRGLLRRFRLSRPGLGDCC